MNFGQKSLVSLSGFALLAIYLCMSFNLVGCKNGLSVADSVLASTDVQFSGGRRLSTSGRTMAQVGSDSDALTFLPGVSILAIVDGVTYRAMSSPEGGFAIREVPMRPATDNTSISDNLATVVLYIEKPGWIFDGDTVTPGNQNWVSVKIDSHLIDTSGNFHVDLGPLKLTQSSLKVMSSLVKSSTVLPNLWLGSNTSVGTTGMDEVYMRDVDSQITLTFNMPVDVTYNTNFVEIFDTSGRPHSFIGTWDATGMVYTIFPDTLTASNDDSQRWQLRIARPVRAFDTVYATRKELDKVSFSLQVLNSNRNTLLTAAAPSLAPELDGSGYTGYDFDSGIIYKSGYQAGVNSIDVVTSGTSVCIVWNQSQAATNLNEYRIYARSPYKAFGSWNDVTASWLPLNYMGDGRAYACNSSLYSSLAYSAALQKSDRIQLVVTPVDKDGNEGAISAVATPLTISDNWGPSLSSGSWSKTYTGNEPDEYFNSAPTGRMTLNFSEAMDPWTATQLGAVSSLSGLMSSVTGTQFKLTSTTSADVKIAYSMQKLDTTLSSTARTGDTSIQLTSIAGLKKGYILKLYDSSLNLSEDVTIASIKSLENIIILSSGLSNSYPENSIVRLTLGEAGHSLFVTSTSGDAYSNATTLRVLDGSKFIPNQVIKVYLNDEEGTPSLLGSYTVLTASTNTLTLTSKLGRLIPSGSFVVDSSLSASIVEPQPRAASSTFTPAADLEWLGATTNTTLAINNFARTPDAQTANILVNSTNNLSINDVVTVDASSVSATSGLTTKAIPSNTSLSIGTHSFLVGDTVRLTPPNVSSNLSASVLAGSTSLDLDLPVTIVQSETVTIIDPAFETTLTSAFANGSSSITVSGASGIVQGQTIVIDSGVESSESKTVSSVSGNTITLSSSLSNKHGLNGRVTRLQLTESKTASADITNATTLTVGSLTNPYSINAYISIQRNYADYQVSAISATTLTISSIAANVYYPVGTSVTLLSYPETRRITAINGNILTLSAALSYSHRLGANVTKGSQYTMQISSPSTTMASWIVGDTVVCDSLSSTTGANKDRFELTLAAMDSSQGLATLIPTRPGLITTTNLSCIEMGDAIKIQGVLDSNGQAIRTTWGNKINLNSGTAR